MGPEQKNLDHRQARLAGLWERMVQTLGVYTVNVLLDRAIWHVAQQYPELARIQYGDDGLSFEALVSTSPLPAEGAYEALYDEMLLIMARLLGKDMARRLIDELKPEEPSATTLMPSEG
ncbi:MAG: hypothetical protein HGA45_14995 [Chloroflexales bacterium]|nr:hypothetical protein [Chloroflexales bacterium]